MVVVVMVVVVVVVMMMIQFFLVFFLRVYPGSFKILVFDLQTSVILSLVLDFVWFCTFWIFLEVIFLAAGLHNHDQMFVT
jgi:hypothetical protein